MSTGVVNTVAAGMEQVIANRGQIVLISSVFAFINGMGTIPYAMSKAAVEQLGRGLRLELADHEVSVLTAYFSLVDTDMVEHGVDDDRRGPRAALALPKPMLKRVTPAQAATAIVDGLETEIQPASSAPRCGAPSRRCGASSARRWIPSSPATAASSTSSTRLDARPATAPPATRTKEAVMTTWRDHSHQDHHVDGTPFAYRELGDPTGVPVVFLHHFTAVLDDWDPRSSTASLRSTT